MKKIFLFILITSMLFLSSCSNSIDTSESNSFILLRKEVWSGISYDYTYQGSKLVKIVGSDGYNSNFTYTGDLITKVESVDPQNSFVGHEEYYYSGNNLIQIKEYYGTVLNRKIDMIYNNDNTRTRTHIYYNGINTTTVYKDFYINEECVKTQRFNTNGTVASTINFIYDGYNCKSKNITGYKYIAGWENYDSPFHNILKKTETSLNMNTVQNFSYEYNSDGYPIKVTTTTSSGVDVGQYYY